VNTITTEPTTPQMCRYITLIRYFCSYQYVFEHLVYTSRVIVYSKSAQDARLLLQLADQQPHDVPDTEP